MKSNKKIKDSFSWTNPKLCFKKIPKVGGGVFTNGKIKRGEIVAIFGGYIMTRKEESLLPKELNDNGIFISETLVLGVRKKSELELASYFNHSCNPNCGFNGQIFLVAMRNISVGEDMTFDYAMVLHRSKGSRAYSMNCFCKSQNCRKVITDNDWKDKILQKKYKGYFQPYIEEKINKK